MIFSITSNKDTQQQIPNMVLRLVTGYRKEKKKKKKFLLDRVVLKFLSKSIIRPVVGVNFPDIMKRRELENQAQEKL